MDANVNAHLEMVQAERGVAVSAYVASPETRPVRWKLELKSQSAGGSNNIAQGGVVAGEKTSPVSSVVVTQGSRGTVTLLVYEGEQVVARDEIVFGEPSGG
ncbi:curli-like amyloid fiber formation chaperone CsgH [Asticcacaulis tiandongensis]|uniref:curli-like amyloid fiber formation chaperone CsgH n=1 Tax=Asticcacaulis tiandongensis TaxID=2565365 RepID=UPI00112E1DF6|nr:curli-like amyloid fiber formation chaperone CsgH [Asticcacaulis tiandongensis]